ncbi:hypothetical protein AGMMS50293_08160 [Spirochaetia bacterium]|nr:hypothetical protein AGMMS50293_08160 [Spirochaetia bacterium]
MRIQKSGFTVAGVFVLAVCAAIALFTTCSNPAGGDGAVPATDKTYIQFNNLEVFPVTVYSDPSRLTKIADVDAGGNATVTASPAPLGTAFYPRYHLSVEGIAISPYDGDAIMARIDEKRTNTVAIPPLEAIEAGDAFIKLENASYYSLIMRKGSVEMLPIGSGSTIVMQNETAGYSIPPGASSGYSLMKNGTDPVAFPGDLTQFQAGYVYLLRYNGTALVLSEAAKPVFRLRHTVRYDANGGNGSAPTQQVVIQGSSAAAADQGALSRTGYTFSGWNTNAAGTGASYNPGSSLTISANTTLYAQWTAIIYTINYHANGASGTAPSPQSAAYGGSLAISGQGGLSLAGRLFDGWNTSADGTGTSYPEGSSITMNADLALYAQWIDPATIRYTVSYDANGGSGSVPASQMATNGTIIAVSNPGGLSNSGMGFNGWNTQPGGGGTPYTAGSSLTVSGDITLYAQWVVQYTVSYVLNGGSGTVPASQTVNSGSNVTVAGQGSLLRDGCTFNGWNTDASGSGTAYATGSSLTVSGDITLFAQWNVTVTYNANGGSGTVSAQTVNPGSSVTIASGSGLTQPGYAFIGWNSSSSGLGTNYVTGTALTVNENITLYAVWGIPENLSLAASLAWIASNAVDGAAYTITVKADEAITTTTLSYSEKTVALTLKGDSSVKTISLNANGSLFTISSKVTLTLDNNVTLQGRSDNTAALVWLNNGGTLIMNNGSKITGNAKVTVDAHGGGGVYVNGGTFTMAGGEISGNTGTGGGVHVVSGTFTMTGGEISGNTNPIGSGGGVAVSQTGIFTMTAGEISGNTAFSGGGVYANGTFTMSGGEISGNTASIYGGGVHAQRIFTKTGGTIYGADASPATLKNTAGNDNYGHAVYVHVSISLARKRNTTAGTSVNLNNGTAANWE